MKRCAATLLLAAAAVAGEIGPADVAVVYNADSVASRSVAQAWMRLRGVPDANAVGLHGLPLGEEMPLAELLPRILQPVERTLAQRGLAARISVVAYAPDLPWALRFDGGPQQIGRYGPAALTGMTLLAPLIAHGPAVFTAADANPYAETLVYRGAEADRRADADPRSDQAMQRFTAKDPAGAEGLLRPLVADVPAPGAFYNLACALALQGRADEAAAALGEAVRAGWLGADLAEGDSDLTPLRTRPEWPGLLAAMRDNAAAVRAQPPQGFTALPAADADGVPGRLAMVLAVCGGRGLALDEALAGLAASAAADASRPAGTVWFMRSGDRARTGPRAWAFPAAVRGLQALGVDARAADGVLPPAGATVCGAMAGIADFDWARSGAAIVPGAWCDHLTSYAGALQPGAGQTPLTAWLRAGAAGSGGAVAEPWAFPSKFPSPFVHQHRVEGLSLVEAVHRTLAQPFQYLAVGDPLSRPWSDARAPLPPPPAQRLAWSQALPLRLVAAPGTPVAVHHLGRVVASGTAGRDGWRGSVAAAALGIGPQRLLLTRSGAPAASVEVDVLPPPPLPALADPGATAPGARLPAGGILAQPTQGAWADALAQGGEVAGWIRVADAGLHRFAWSSSRLAAVSWDDQPWQPLTAGPGDQPVALAAGWHRLRLRLAAGPGALSLRFGRHGDAPLSPDGWRHVP